MRTLHDREKTCAICGATFMGKSRAKYCPDCKKNTKKHDPTEYMKPKEEEMPKKEYKRSKYSMTEKNEIARKHGMSYGQMQALLDQKGLSWDEWEKAVGKPKKKPEPKKQKPKDNTSGQAAGQENVPEVTEPEEGESLLERFERQLKEQKDIGACFTAVRQQDKTSKRIKNILNDDLVRLGQEREDLLAGYHKLRKTMDAMERRQAEIDHMIIAIKDFIANTDFE